MEKKTPKINMASCKRRASGVHDLYSTNNKKPNRRVHCDNRNLFSPRMYVFFTLFLAVYESVRMCFCMLRMYQCQCVCACMYKRVYTHSLKHVHITYPQTIQRPNSFRNVNIHENDARARVVVSPFDPDLVATGCGDDRVHVWSMSTGKVTHTYICNHKCVSVTILNRTVYVYLGN